MCFTITNSNIDDANVIIWFQKCKFRFGNCEVANANANLEMQSGIR